MPRPFAALPFLPQNYNKITRIATIPDNQLFTLLLSVRFRTSPPLVVDFADETTPKIGQKHPSATLHRHKVHKVVVHNLVNSVTFPHISHKCHR